MGRAVVVEDFSGITHVDVSLLLVYIPPRGSLTGVGCEEALPNVKLEGAQVDEGLNVAHTGKSVAHGDASIGVGADDGRSLDALHRLPDNLSVVVHASKTIKVGPAAGKLHGADIDVLQFVEEGLPAPVSVPGPVDEKKSRCHCHALSLDWIPRPRGRSERPRGQRSAKRVTQRLTAGTCQAPSGYAQRFCTALSALPRYHVRGTDSERSRHRCWKNAAAARWNVGSQSIDKWSPSHDDEHAFGIASRSCLVFWLARSAFPLSTRTGTVTFCRSWDRTASMAPRRTAVRTFGSAVLALTKGEERAARC